MVQVAIGSNFSEMLERIKLGARAFRKNWNSKEQFIFLVHGSEFEVNRKPLSDMFDVGTKIKYNAHIDIKCADGSIAVWNPSQVDLLSEDWIIEEQN